MAKWTCKIVDNPRHCKMEMLATDAPRLMAMAVAMDSHHHFSKRWHIADIKTSPEMTRQPQCRSKFRKYRVYLPILRLKDRDWCSKADCSFRKSLKRHLVNVKNITGDDQVTLRIDRNSQLPKFMPTRSSKTSQKTSFCCSDAAIMMLLRTVSFPTITRNSFCSHLQTIISRWPWPPSKNRDIHIEGFL